MIDWYQIATKRTSHIVHDGLYVKQKQHQPDDPCKKCKHSWNLTVYERTKPSKIPRAIFEAFQENDGELAAAFGRSIDFLKKNRAEFK